MSGEHSMAGQMLPGYDAYTEPKSVKQPDYIFKNSTGPTVFNQNFFQDFVSSNEG